MGLTYHAVMNRFNTKKLGTLQSFGEQLRQERQRHGLDLRQISFQLKIPEKYLTALEEEALVELPSGSYGKLFLSQYAKFLKLPVAKLAAEYAVRAEYVGRRPAIIGQAKKNLVWPIKRLAWLLIITALIGYLGLEAWRLFSPPPFSVLNPPSNIETQDLTIVVNGKTAPGSTVLLNGATVPVSENGNFSQAVTLQPGLNTLLFTARRTHSQPVIIQREVLVKTLPVEPNF